MYLQKSNLEEFTNLSIYCFYEEAVVTVTVNTKLDLALNK